MTREMNRNVLELLAPARDADTAKAAILAGADSVYIGVSRFGARAAAGNSTDDIAELCRFAHVYGCKVYITLNTILTDAELPEAAKLLDELYRAGADAAIVQDMGLFENQCRFSAKKIKLPRATARARTRQSCRTWGFSKKRAAAFRSTQAHNAT